MWFSPDMFLPEDVDTSEPPSLPSSPVITDSARYLAATLLWEVPADLGNSCGT